MPVADSCYTCRDCGINTGSPDRRLDATAGPLARPPAPAGDRVQRVSGEAAAGGGARVAEGRERSRTRRPAGAVAELDRQVE
jgi:hypothetical protein